MFEFKQRVKDCYLQEWTESVNKNCKLSLFRNLEIEIIPELYLSGIRDSKSVIAKFRCASHGLDIETGRHCQTLTPKEERICLNCGKFQNYVIECELHFLMQCPAYNDLRNEYLSILFTEASSKRY